MNYNKIGTFSNRPQSAGLKSKGNAIKKPTPRNNFIKKANEDKGPTLIQPEWNANPDNPHKLSKAEILTRKMQAKSKHELSAKIELQ